MRHFKMETARSIKRRESKVRAHINRVPLVFINTDIEKLTSGRSFSKGEIRRKAEKVAAKRGWSVSFAEKVVRREIARLKVRKFEIPIGVWSSEFFRVKDYKVTFKARYRRFENRRLCIWRADGCDCNAGSRGHRCWHQDYADYTFDGHTTIPQKYGMWHRDALIRIRRNVRGFKS